MINQQKIDRFTRDLEAMAKEKVRPMWHDANDSIDDVFILGSELACLRIYYEYNRGSIKRGRVEFSKNLNSFTVTIK